MSQRWRGSPLALKTMGHESVDIKSSRGHKRIYLLLPYIVDDTEIHTYTWRSPPICRPCRGLGQVRPRPCRVTFVLMWKEVLSTKISRISRREISMLYPLATAGPAVSAPRTPPRRLGVRSSSMQ